MSPNSQQRRERCDDLLVADALYGLDSAEQLEVDELFHEFDLVQDDRFDIAVAALDSAESRHGHPDLPPGFSDQLRQKIVSDASLYVGRTSHRTEPAASPGSQSAVSPASRPSGPDPGVARGWSTREKFFALVTAASLLLAVASLSGLLRPNPDTNLGGKVANVDPPLTGEQRLALLQNADVPDLVKADWTNPTKDATSLDASGHVVWSDSRQEGYMVIDGLAVNDEQKNQYQLWIFDTARDDALPVDGGVFDIDSEGRVIVPIDAKLSITKAKMFAVTIEDPGGVVQSKRERLPLLAPVPEA